jgi:hypothetical protein
MIPVKYLEDLKTAPIDKVDFVATFQEVMFPFYPYVDTNGFYRCLKENIPPWGAGRRCTLES